MAFPGVDGAIVGARRPGQVDDWLPAAGLVLDDADLDDADLDDADLDDIAAAVTANGAGDGPLRP